MYHYNFTNDLRITSLDEILKEASNAFLTDTVPSASEDKSKNNNFMTVGFYFNLKAKGNCAKLASKGNTRKVVLNFIKKFQFPNPRTSADYENSINDKILLAPMRDIVKILHILSLTDIKTAFLTKDEIENFIFYNDDLAKRQNYNLLLTANQIIQYRKDSNIPQNINTVKNEHIWNHSERQIREMIKTLNYTGCFTEDDNGIKLKTKGITRDNEADLFEIINCNSYWTGETAEDYQKYMDEISIMEEIMEIQESTKNKNTLTSSQTIYYGVPGSGKSHKINEIIKDIPDEQKMRVVFHPEYTNADFVGQILPVQDSEGIDYRFKAGPFSRILKKALKNPDKPYFLIIEEINRGNAAAIFGDLFQLLDRKADGWSSYSIDNLDINAFIRSEDDRYSEKNPPSSKKIGEIDFTENSSIRLPPNLSLYATMNTSDQNVFTLDNAFQRRWDMKLIENKFKGKDAESQRNAKIGGSDVTWEAFQTHINKKIGEMSSSMGMSSMEDKRLGCWFVKAEEGEISKETFAEKVLKYLWDDAFKFNRDEIFDIKDKAVSLETIVQTFKNGDEAICNWSIFKDTSFISSAVQNPDSASDREEKQE
ncbi:AAA family ATPase [Treponema sp.]|uniref:AAA family ATPase n=1 Tax=Treponema sp. TaxID=166 RepID=UPI0025E966CF|nr:AAA family ATPase [Treponema sp.]MCR5218699.1 AAA family ATPase [Treponema sp.]